MLRSCIPVLVCLALVVSGCQVIRPPAPSAPAPRATATVSGRPATPTPASAPTVSPGGPITLTVWLPDALIQPGNEKTKTLLTQQLSTFTAALSDVRVQVLVKRARGSGGILDLVQAAASVAPSVLPDVTLLDLAEVPEAAQAELLRPLNGLVPDSVLADLFPFASAARLDNRWVAIAYAADIQHVAYGTAYLQSPPITWAQVLSESLPYLFPAGAVGGMPADTLFAQYAAAGGRWLDATGQPSLDVTALTQMLRQLKDAQSAGVVTLNVLNYSSPDDTWSAYLSAPTQMVEVRASRFIAQRTIPWATAVAPLPGRDQAAQSIARGWALVVPGRDPAHLPAAASLVAWLASPENEGAWTLAANLLPARRSAFDYWYPSDAYTAFVYQELERALPPPPAHVAQAIGPAIQKAVADVLRGQSQPAEAAATAAASVGRAK